MEAWSGRGPGRSSGDSDFQAAVIGQLVGGREHRVTGLAVLARHRLGVIAPDHNPVLVVLAHDPAGLTFVHQDRRAGKGSLGVPFWAGIYAIEAWGSRYPGGPGVRGCWLWPAGRLPTLRMIGKPTVISGCRQAGSRAPMMITPERLTQMGTQSLPLGQQRRAASGAGG
jgi:hypothetical protein